MQELMGPYQAVGEKKRGLSLVFTTRRHSSLGAKFK